MHHASRSSQVRSRSRASWIATLARSVVIQPAVDRVLARRDRDHCHHGSRSSMGGAAISCRSIPIVCRSPRGFTTITRTSRRTAATRKRFVPPAPRTSRSSPPTPSASAGTPRWTPSSPPSARWPTRARRPSEHAAHARRDRDAPLCGAQEPRVQRARADALSKEDGRSIDRRRAASAARRDRAAREVRRRVTAHASTRPLTQPCRRFFR